MPVYEVEVGIKRGTIRPTPHSFTPIPQFLYPDTPPLFLVAVVAASPAVSTALPAALPAIIKVVMAVVMVATPAVIF